MQFHECVIGKPVIVNNNRGTTGWIVGLGSRMTRDLQPVAMPMVLVQLSVSFHSDEVDTTTSIMAVDPDQVEVYC